MDGFNSFGFPLPYPTKRKVREMTPFVDVEASQKGKYPFGMVSQGIQKKQVFLGIPYFEKHPSHVLFSKMDPLESDNSQRVEITSNFLEQASPHSEVDIAPHFVAHSKFGLFLASPLKNR